MVVTAVMAGGVVEVRDASESMTRFYFFSASVVPNRDGVESSLSASTVPSARITLFVRPTNTPLLAWYT